MKSSVPCMGIGTIKNLKLDNFNKSLGDLF